MQSRYPNLQGNSTGEPMECIELETPRLRLRAWRDADLDPLLELCSDPLVMRYFPELLSRDECAAAMARSRIHFTRFGFGYWALELKSDERFIGMAGLAWSRLQQPFCPAVEIGWRLSPEFWGKGIVTEAALRWLDYGFNELRLPRIVSFTVDGNERSAAVMRRIGMTHRPDMDFEHPKVPDTHPHLKRHVFYELTADDWRARQAL